MILTFDWKWGIPPTITQVIFVISPPTEAPIIEKPLTVSTVSAGPTISLRFALLLKVIFV